MSTKTKSQLAQEIRLALEPVRVEWAKVAFWTDMREAAAVAAAKGWPASSVVSARTSFHAGYALRHQGRLLSRAAYERSLPKVPKEKHFYLEIERDGKSVTISEHHTITEAKAAAKRLVADGTSTVDVYQWASGGHYLQGVMKADGWSPV